MIGDNLEVPFETMVLGVTVTVQKITQTESGIVANCVRDGHHQAISVLDLPLPEPPPKGSEWVACEGAPVREDVLGRTGPDRLGCGVPFPGDCLACLSEGLAVIGLRWCAAQPSTKTDMT